MSLNQAFSGRSATSSLDTPHVFLVFARIGSMRGDAMATRATALLCQASGKLRAMLHAGFLAAAGDAPRSGRHCVGGAWYMYISQL